MKPTKNRRPSPVHLGDLRARVVRGPNEAGLWYWRIWKTVDGKEATVNTGWWTLVEVQQEIAQVAVSGKPTKTGKARTVRDLLEFWMGEQEQRADLSKNTVSNRRGTARRILKMLGDLDVSRIDMQVLERYRDQQIRTGAAPRTVQTDMAVFRLAWRWGIDAGLLMEPVPRAIKIRVRETEYYYNRSTPSPAHVAKVLEQLSGWPRLALLLYAGTGARLGEILSLTWSNVDLETQTILVKGKMGKREIPLIDELVEALKAAKIESAKEEAEGSSRSRFDLVIPAAPKSVRLRLATACRRAGVPVFPVGGLRRAAVAAMYSSGIDPSVAGRILGHSPEVAMRHYRQVSAPEAAEGMRRARLLQSIVTDTNAPGTNPGTNPEDR